MADRFRRRVPHPIFRKLRVFAIDPGMTARFETAVMNVTTVAIPWEPLEPGPVGEYVAIVDQDEAGKRVHDAVNLDWPDILAQNGLPPSDANPQFRQQMVYAVAMRTIRNFERALGRAIHWAPHIAAAGKKKEVRATYRRRLELYPHYLKEANAYYSPEKQRLLFGYFLSSPESPFPGTTVFSCLSQDVIAHEITHALLMGMHVDLRVGDNPDVMAFHEAFSDIVALLQHFSPSDVLRHQIDSIRGHLDERSSLGAVGLQFGQALGRVDGLRNALGFTGNDNPGHSIWDERMTRTACPRSRAARLVWVRHCRSMCRRAKVSQAALRRLFVQGLAGSKGISRHGSHPNLYGTWHRAEIRPRAGGRYRRGSHRPSIANVGRD
jgi:hypothetical protein